MSSTCPQTTWRFAEADEAAVAKLARETGLSPLVAHILVSRGMTDGVAARRFLEPSLSREWLDSGLIPGMSEAAAAVAEAVRTNRHVVVFGDFDLDGVSAAAVAARGLLLMGARVSAVVPHRFREGYGLSEAAIHRVLSLMPDLVVTVDCGISGASAASMLAEAGVDLVVTDHHEPGEGVPTGVPVADPKLDSSCPSRDLAGAGVALKLVQAVGELLGHAELWRSLTDLATLGTVADVVPLTGENRALVADGVGRMRREPRVSLAALAAVAGVNPDSFSADSVAYTFAPRLNAAGRLDDPQIALDLLMTDDPEDAERLAGELDSLNRERQSIEAELATAAGALAERTWRADERVLVLAGEGWHEGVKGIVASRMVNAYRVPAFLFSVEDGVARGSGRSSGSVDLFQALDTVSDLLDRFGGHAGAVGLQLPEANLGVFKQRLIDYLATLPAEQFESPLVLDLEVPLDAVGVELGAEMSLLAPFGHGNPKPMLASSGVFMNGRSKVGRGGDHLKFDAFDGVASVPAIAFRCKDIDELVREDRAVDIAYELEVDEWRGRTRAQLIVRDVRGRPEDPEAPARELVDELFDRADEFLAREEYAGITDAPSFHTKLAGVTFEGRQDVLARLAGGVALRLDRQPENEYDSNACALFDPHGSQVGFLNRRLAAVLAPAIDAGVEYDVEVTDVTGGEEGRTLGVNVLMTRRDALGGQGDDEGSRAATRARLSALPTEELESELVSRFIGERTLHSAQIEALAHLAVGANTLAVMATGRGKSLIFHMHAARTALRHGQASVFVYPLRALVADQVFHLKEVFSDIGISVETVTGETSPSDRDAAFDRLASGQLDVVLTTPEFLDIHSGRFARTGRIGFLVVDEAHHVGMSRAGHRPAYARLGEAAEAIGSPVVCAVTATASDDVAASITSTLGIERVVLDPTVRENLRIEDHRGAKSRDDLLAAIAGRGEKTVIYVNSRDQTVKLARMLRKRLPDLGNRVAFYNGGLNRSMRHAVERAFRAGEIALVVSTSAFGEGVNIPDIRNVVLYHLPFNEVEFNQMSGRAGRDGALARIHLLFGEQDARINEAILSSSAPEPDDMRALYRVLLELAEREGPGFEITNAELAERSRAIRPRCRLDEGGVSSSLGVFRELGFLTSEGHGVYRSLTLVPNAPKVELTTSVRYREGQDEIDEFAGFREWALTSEPDMLLARFNRPILPSRTSLM